MDDAWEVLSGSGLPEGPIRRPPRGPLDPASVRAAVTALNARCDEIEPWRREPLLAWLRGFRHHWPERFATVLGPPGDECISKLSAQAHDTNRYLKLRRIAIENLSHVL